MAFNMCKYFGMTDRGNGDKKKTSGDKNYEKNRKRKIIKKWFEEFSWLRADEESETIYCGICREYHSISDPKSALVKGISRNFKRESLQFHDTSVKHQLCISRKCSEEKPSEVPLHKTVKLMHEKRSEQFKTLFNKAYYIAKEAQAVSKFAGLCALQQKNGLQIGKNYLNDHACSNFIKSIADSMKKQTCEMLQQSRFISVMSDGSTDKGILEQEIVFVRYYNDGDIKTEVADIVELEAGDSKGVQKGIYAALQTVNISTETLAEKCICINTDGAAVNTGKKSGVIKLIKDDIALRHEGQSEHVTAVHCVAHNLELAVCDMKKEVKYLTKFEEILKGIFKLYYYSPKQTRELESIAENLEENLKHFGGLQQIRWVASQNRALVALKENLNPTVMHLEHITQGTDEHSKKAHGYLAELKSKRFLLFLHFMIDFTNLIQMVSKVFQQDECLIATVADKIETLIEKIKLLKTKPGQAMKKFKEDYDNSKQEFKGFKIKTTERARGKKTETSSQESENETDESLVTKDIQDIVASAENFMDERFIKHITGEPLSLFNIFNFHKWPQQREQLTKFGQEDLDKLTEVFSPLLTEDEKSHASDEWIDLKMLLKRRKTRPLQEVYLELLQQAPDEVRHILPLVEIMLCVSPSTAACERGFSALNRLKTELRTRMNASSLSSLLKIQVDGPRLDAFEPGPSILHWLESGPGKRHVSGHKLPGPRPKKSKPEESYQQAGPSEESEIVQLSSDSD